jgi:hypothetical protein
VVLSSQPPSKCDLAFLTFSSHAFGLNTLPPLQLDTASIYDSQSMSIVIPSTEFYPCASCSDHADPLNSSRKMWSVGQGFVSKLASDAATLASVDWKFQHKVQDSSTRKIGNFIAKVLTRGENEMVRTTSEGKKRDGKMVKLDEKDIFYLSS